MKKTVLMDELLDAMEIGGMDIRCYFELQKEQLIRIANEWANRNNLTIVTKEEK